MNKSASRCIKLNSKDEYKGCGRVYPLKKTAGLCEPCLEFGPAGYCFPRCDLCGYRTLANSQHDPGLLASKCTCKPQAVQKRTTINTQPATSDHYIEGASEDNGNYFGWVMPRPK